MSYTGLELTIQFRLKVYRLFPRVPLLEGSKTPRACPSSSGSPGEWLFPTGSAPCHDLQHLQRHHGTESPWPQAEISKSVM